MNDIFDKNNIFEFWEKALDEIRKSISKPSFDTWIAPLTAHVEDQTIIITTQNDISKDWVEERYKPLLLEKIKEVGGRDFVIKIVSSETLDEEKNLSFTSRIKGLDQNQALGYFLLACKDANVPEETIKEVYKNMKWYFDMKSREDAEEEGHKWFRSLIKS
ncbi:DnaA N-terminal domain-containing protein [Cytobacillus dafuensis]|uniref:DnaA N-terminal domain-containing protein n=1 Tax=Cytobacillus dafuensis TaxID=1742359 RepID=A0A5B8Z5X4_CYTDA|nr:DnaA N-terminal domain-containing protein [Cytobacillus dafuensis]QED47009.1 hypothetical protein FSZ17_07000 [Cytobacillus dafuensis]